MATEPPRKPRNVYSSLPDPTKYIRLLKIEADPTDTQRNDGVRISIEEHPFDRALAYHAVSYAWGSPTEEVITLDTAYGEEHMSVRRSCADVLRQLARFQPSHYYWVDAICINQDDEHEKGFQVDMMGSIFGQAECVLACVGMPQGDHRSLKDWLSDSPTLCFPEGIQGNSEQESELNVRRSKQWLDGLPAAHVLQFTEALDEVAKLPYFTRVWILQELFLARRLRIFYGVDELSLPALLFWWRQLRPAHSTKIKGGDSPILFDKLCTIGAGRAYIDNMKETDPNFFTGKGGYRVGKAYEDYVLGAPSILTDANATKRCVPLNDLLDLCKNRLCQNPIDTVYGTLQIADWQGASTITLEGELLTPTDSVLKADYTKTRLNLAKELLPYFNGFRQIQNFLKMLKITEVDVRRSVDVAQRLSMSPSLQVGTDEDILSMAKLSTQNHVHVAGGCIQLKSKGPYKVKYHQTPSGAYAEIIGPEAEICGHATADVQIGDWVFPTCCRYGLVIRQTNANGIFHNIVGRVAWFSAAPIDIFWGLPFMFYLGVEDVIIHLVLNDDISEGSTEQEPSDALRTVLDLPFCSEPFSSFAVMLDERLDVLEADFEPEEDGEDITCRAMGRWRDILLEMRNSREDSSLSPGLP